MTADQVRELLREKIGTGTNAEFARQLDVSRAYIGDVLNGSRAPGPTILNALGLARGITIDYYFKKRKARGGKS